jgi:hypothetical protein
MGKPEMTTPRDRIAEIKARYEAATEGPWFTGVLNGEPLDVWTGGENTYLAATIAKTNPDPYFRTKAKEDADFIAHARQDLPDMVAFTEAILHLTPIESPELIEGGYGVLASDIRALAEKHLGGNDAVPR